MKLFLIVLFLVTFSTGNAQTKTTTLTNFDPSGLGSEVIILTIPADKQTKSDNITYVKNVFSDGKYCIIGYGTDDKLSYVSTNKLGVAKYAIVDYDTYTKNGDGASQYRESCTWCACVKACAVSCQTNWCNVACLIGCIP